MLCCAYYRGDINSPYRNEINEFIERQSLKDVEILNDAGDSICNFRIIQNIIKLGLCNVLIIPSLSTLSDDDILKTEYELFMLRNNVKLVAIHKETKDNRYGIINGIKRYFSIGRDWETRHGDVLPLPSVMYESNRIPPFGYMLKDNEVVPKDDEVAVIRKLFEGYGNGESLEQLRLLTNGLVTRRGNSFSTTTLKTMLQYDRYIGVPSKTAYALPGIITYAEWFKAAARLYKSLDEQDKHDSRFPFCRRVQADKGIIYYRDSCWLKSALRGKTVANKYIINTNKLEEEVLKLISKLCKQENVPPLYSYAVKNREMVERLIPKTRNSLYNIEREFDSAFEKMLLNDCADELQEQVHTLRDKRYVERIRLRRTETERELFSITESQLLEFFDRGASLIEFSSAEQAFYAEVFISRIQIENSVIKASYFSPKNGKIFRATLDSQNIIKQV